MHNFEWASYKYCLAFLTVGAHIHQLMMDNPRAKGPQTSDPSFRRAQGPYMGLTVHSLSILIFAFVSLMCLYTFCYSHTRPFLVVFTKVLLTFSQLKQAPGPLFQLSSRLHTMLYVATKWVKRFPSTALLGVGAHLSPAPGGLCLNRVYSLLIPPVHSIFLLHSSGPHSSSFHSLQGLCPSLDWEPPPDHIHVHP